MRIAIENYDTRKQNIAEFLSEKGIGSLTDAAQICTGAGLDIFATVRGIQPFCFEDACWAYTVGAAAALRSDAVDAGDIALIIGEGLQAFCQKGTVADQRQLGIGHGRIAKMVLSEDMHCFRIKGF